MSAGMGDPVGEQVMGSRGVRNGLGRWVGILTLAGLVGSAGCGWFARPAVPAPTVTTPAAFTAEQIKASIQDAAQKYGGRLVAKVAPAPSAPTVTNTWVDTDLKQVLTDITAQTKIPILMDPQLQGTVTLALQDTPLPNALEQVALPLGLAAQPFGEGWLVGPVDNKSALYPYLLNTHIFRPAHLRAEDLRQLLPDAYGSYVKVDNKRNTLLLTAPAALVPRIRTALTDLDQRPRQLVIEAIVVDLSRQALDELGITWSAKTPDGLSTGLADAAGLALTWAGPLTQIKLISKLKALETDSQARVIASPRILALEGEPAAIFIGTEQYFSFQSGPVNFPFITVEKVPAGIELDLTVVLATDEDVLVDVKKAEASTAVPTADNRPLVNRRRASTRVRIPNGGTIAIGGLRQRGETQSYEGLPWLARVPLLGALSGSRRWKQEESELVIFLSSATAATAEPFARGRAGS